MNCTEFEILLADFLDGALANESLASEGKQEFLRHQASCPACAELALDAGAAMTFLNRVPVVIPPPAMVSRILAATSGVPSRTTSRTAGRLRLRFPRWLAAAWQPQFAMGVAMALLSLVIAARFWSGASDGALRAWDRTVRGYENMPMISEVRDQLQEWVNDRTNGREGENQ